MSTDYAKFLDNKRITVSDSGFDVGLEVLEPGLFPFQARIVQWALRKGKAAIFAGTGLGKTRMQLKWAAHAAAHAGLPALVFAPLAVAQQTAREGAAIGIPVTVCRSQEDVRPGINVTNYDRLHLFDSTAFGAIVIDESSILKAYSGVTRKALNAFAREIPYRLACTATPAPNDTIELINHAEWLGIMSGKEMIALYFTQDGNTTHNWRLKGHARRDFWAWLSTWAVAVRKPSDLGFDDSGYDLPPLEVRHHIVEGPSVKDGALFATEAEGLAEQRKARRGSLAARVAACVDLVNGDDQHWIVWCDLNDESAALTKAISGAVEVKGSDTPEHKANAMLDFADGKIRVLVSKPSLCGFGMNFQNCARQAFVGIGYSYEAFYQAVRRSWRFGQTRPVEVTVFASTADAGVIRELQRKEEQALEMFEELVRHGLSDAEATRRQEMTYEVAGDCGNDWKMLLGDCCERIREVESDSVGLSIFSPPFPGMYAYTNSTRDIGNTKDMDEMLTHFRHLVGADGLMRVLMPGRTVAIHLMQLQAMKSREGYVGLHDYRGRTIQLMQEEGWIYAGEATIEKNPQIQATRNKEHALLFKSLAEDAAIMRMALADYLIYFRKPGKNPEPIRAGISSKYNAGGGWISEEEWIEFASPVWFRQREGVPGGIRETDVLNVRQARETDDERHLCPLQLGVIERAVKLWSNPGDLVLSPFGGIGSEGYKALEFGRRYQGIELKRAYWESACRNLRTAEAKRGQASLFDLAPSGEVEPPADVPVLEVLEHAPEGPAPEALEPQVPAPAVLTRKRKAKEAAAPSLSVAQ